MLIELSDIVAQLGYYGNDSMFKMLIRIGGKFYPITGKVTIDKEYKISILFKGNDDIVHMFGRNPYDIITMKHVLSDAPQDSTHKTY